MARRRRKRRRGGLPLGALYRGAVALSAVIVALYAAYSLLIKPPPISQKEPSQLSGPGSSATPPDASSSQQPTPPPEPERQRRELVYNFLLLGKDRESGNTDTIIIVSYDIPRQKVGMISIPRDTVVEREWSRYPKINYAYSSGGVETLKDEIEHTFGIPIDYYIYVDLRGFVALVNELDGVDVDIPEDMNYDDPYQDLSIHYTKGRHHLNGQQAMEVVRFRHNNDGSGYNDEGRAAMQRQVLAALAQKVLSWGSLAKIGPFLDIVQSYVKTDLTADYLVYFATQALGFDISTGLTQSALPGRGDGYYKGYQWCYVFQAEEILPVLNETVNPYDKDLTAEDLHLPAAEGYYFN